MSIVNLLRCKPRPTDIVISHTFVNNVKPDGHVMTTANRPSTFVPKLVGNCVICLPKAILCNKHFYCGRAIQHEIVVVLICVESQ
jgi:hypothetical protein